MTHSTVPSFSSIAGALLLTLAVSLVGCHAERRDASARPPDVLIVTFDTLRVDAVGAWGDAQARTPVLDALAARGMRFAQATTPFPRTTPAIASLFSGRLPNHHGSREVGEPMDETVSILADVLATRGYRSVAAVGNAVAISGDKFRRSFQLIGAGEPRTTADVVTDQLLNMVRRIDDETPLLMWAHYVDPHFPYLVPEEFVEGPVDDCLALRGLWLDGGESRIVTNRDGVAAASLASCRAQYRDAVAFADHEVGRLLAGLRDSGRDPDRAVVVFTADHGEHFGEQGLYFEHGPRVHDAVLRVPLVFAGPGIRAGVDSRSARLQDVMPTVLHLLGFEPDALPESDGVDLSPWLSDRHVVDAERPDLVSVAESGSSLRSACFDSVSSGRAADRHCVNDGRWSYCASGDAESGGSYELYDHGSDPALSVPLTSRHPDVVARMQEILRLWPPEQARWFSARTSRFKLVKRPTAEGGYDTELYDLSADPGETTDVAIRFPDNVESLGRALDLYVQDLPARAASNWKQEDLEALRELGYVD